jgi:microcystin degradation protein MlrC
MKRVFFAMLGTETNTFSPIPTGWGIWRDTVLRRRREQEPTVSRAHSVYAPLFALLDRRGWELVPGLQAFATPGGITPRAVYESLRDELLDDLAHAGRVDAVLLFLHGAMVADGYDDCEGDLLTRVRALTGTNVPVGAELDLHCHVTDAMLTAADVLVGYKHYPHTDTYDRLLDLFRILADAAEGKVTPRMARARCQMLGMFHTTREPMTGLVANLYALEQQPGVLNAWLAHGFPYGDVPEAGACAVVVTDGDEALAQQLARGIRDDFFAVRNDVMPPLLTIDAAIDAALAQRAGPVTIADTADNTGGGAPGDSTFFLQALLARGTGGVAVGPLYDPGAVAICHDAGAGAVLQLRIGGKLGTESGAPVDVACEVIAISERVIQTLNGGPSNLGRSASVRIALNGSAETIEVVLTSKRVQAGSPELFSALGIFPQTKRLLVVKSTQHFHAGFAPISSAVLYTADRGALQGRMQDIPYRRIHTADYWPFTERPALPDA